MNRNPVEETEYQNLMKSTGAGLGSGGPNFEDFFRQQAAGRQTLNDQQNAREGDFLTRFRSMLGGQEALPAMAQRIGGELGLPTLRQNTQQLSTSIANMPYTQRAATRGFDVNQNQLDRLTQAKQAELVPVYTASTNALGTAERSLGEQLGYGVQQQQKELMPFQQEAGMISERAAREMTGYSQDMQNQLTVLLQKMANNQALTMAETAQANQLALQENTYQKQRDLLAQNPEQSWMSVTPGGQLFNTQTNKFQTIPGKTVATGGGPTSTFRKA